MNIEMNESAEILRKENALDRQHILCLASDNPH